MSTPREGQRVSYVGEPNPQGLAVADAGRVLTVTGANSHVMWDSGRLTGKVTFEENDDLVVSGASAPSAIEDSLDDGTLVSVAVRDTYDTAGDVGLLNALAEAGHLASMSSYAEEAFSLVASRVREDPAFKSVLAALEPDEGAALVTLTSAVLLRDAFTEEQV